MRKGSSVQRNREGGRPGHAQKCMAAVGGAGGHRPSFLVTHRECDGWKSIGETETHSLPAEVEQLRAWEDHGDEDTGVLRWGCTIPGGSGPHILIVTHRLLPSPGITPASRRCCPWTLNTASQTKQILIRRQSRF